MIFLNKKKTKCLVLRKWQYNRIRKSHHIKYNKKISRSMTKDLKKCKNGVTSDLISHYYFLAMT